MPLLDYQPILQRGSHDCGPVVVEVCLRYLGINPTPIVRDLPVTEWDGLDPRSAEGTLRKHKLCAISGESLLDDLKHAAKMSRPTMCLITLSGMGHWVASRGVHAGRVYYHDPSHGPKDMKIKDWLDRWHDRDHSGTYWWRFALQIWNPAQ